MAARLEIKYQREQYTKKSAFQNNYHHSEKIVAKSLCFVLNFQTLNQQPIEMKFLSIFVLIAIVNLFDNDRNKERQC
jgi:hypothetical protein